MRHVDDKVNHSADAPAEALVEALHAVVHALRARQHESLAQAGVALSPLEVRVLAFFARQPGATQRDLIVHSGRDKGQVARLVRSLHEQGLLELQADDDDGRITRIHLTPVARQLSQAVQRQRGVLARQAFQGVAPDEARAALRLLQRMRQNLEPGTA